MEKMKIEKIIDAHMHFSSIDSFKKCAWYDSSLNYSHEGFAREKAENGIVYSVCMGVTETSPGAFPDKNAPTPMLADYSETVEHLPDGMLLCPGINPHALSERNLAALEDVIRSTKKVVGLKIYAGYYHFDIFDPIYEPAYRLAEKYDLTVAVHMGDTFSDRGLLAYSHPLHADRLAFAHRDMRIVICHLGVPWVFDACEAALKNRNVYLDLSGILVGDAAYIEKSAAKPLLLDRYRQALTYLDNYDKVMFGTDWPLAPTAAYVDFCKKLVPPEEYEKVFYRNALMVYHRGEE